MRLKSKTLTVAISLAGVLCVGAADLAYAGKGKNKDKDDDAPAVSGNCAQLSADRTTEFHGNPNTSSLNLAMAGNQWVVFNKVMQAFNEKRAAQGENIDLSAIGNQPRTLAGLRKKGADYFIELIPPGQERNQIKSGCMLLGNEDDRNFLPTSVQVDFDLFTSTNFNLMRDLARSGFVKEAVPYIRNQLTLMTNAANSAGIGTGATQGEVIVDATLDLLNPGIRVSEVDHINEGIHRGINAMYQRMDEFVRLNGSASDISALDSALAAVSTPQAGSPAATRTGVSTNFDLSTNAACHYTGHASIADGTLRLCEFAILNKANTHETRVHHVETPGRILAGESDVGPVWVSELQLAVNNGDAVGGSQMPDNVNRPVVYSIAFLTTMDDDHQDLAGDFFNFIRGEAQQIYIDGGFSGLTGSELAERYSLDANGNLVIQTFTP